jgi:hypothetical protein
MMNRTLLIIVAIALIVVGVATIFLTGSDTTIPIPKPGSIYSSSSNNNNNNKDRNTSSEDLHNNNTGLRSSLNR